VIGKTLAHYKITEKIGAGGMGEVYRASDSKLPREVAVKVLPPDLAGDPTRRARFDREAAVVAALNHPNIVTIHSVEEADGVQFLTMELVEGRTLSEAIPPEGFALEPLLDVAVALADAVGAAHAKGITHRDLKPSNVMLDAEGRPKVLDFGLAKLAEPSPDDRTISSDDATQAGQLIGTVAYMSPEQAQGRVVDPRSDIFSLGIVLYEMATGTHPFRRENNVSTLSAILGETPPSVADVSQDCPAALGAIVARCLARSPDDRYPSGTELRDALRDLKQHSSASRVGEVPTSRADRLRRPLLVMAGAVAALVAAGVLFWQSREATKARWARHEAIPEIERLVDAAPGTGGPNYWEAFVLAR
jgi:serine/threonine protein kinase